MPRRRNEERRILGPYRDGNEWRIVVIDPKAEEENRRSSFTGTRKEIDDLAKDFRARWSELDEITVESALAMYKVARMKDDTTEESIDESIRRIRLMFPDGSKLIDSLTEFDCSAAYDALTEKVEVATHRNILIQARSWLRWCCKKKKWIRTNPLEDVDGVGVANKGKPQLTGDEAKKLRAWLMWRVSRGDEAALACMMLLTMALRQGDVVKRVVRDVDLGGTVLRIFKGKSKKTDRPRVVPNELQDALRKLIENRSAFDPLFVAEGGGFHTKSWLRLAMKRFCPAAGVPYVCPHSLKGTAGTIAHVVGQSAEQVADFLSHEDVRTQQHYVDAVTAQDAAAARGMKVIEGGRR